MGEVGLRTSNNSQTHECKPFGHSSYHHVTKLFLQLLMATESFYIVGMITLKISLSIWFYRFLHKRWQRVTIILILVLTILVGITYFFFEIFQCGVPNKGESWWIKKISNQCVSFEANLGVGYTHALLNAFTDVILVAMPTPVIWHAKLRFKEKLIMLAILFIAIRYTSTLYFSKTFTNKILVEV
jgi:hypothetical protein